MPSRIIVLGSVNVDLVIRAGRLPRPGETVLGGQFFEAPGGKGANQAVAAARAGVDPVTFLAAVGEDAYGADSVSRFGGENLVCDFIKRVPGASTGVALIMVDERGENAISVASGANALLAPDDVDALLPNCWNDARVFLACLESPLETVAHGLRRARDAGLRTLLNPAPADARAAASNLLRLVDVLTPNETEAGQLSGVEVRDRETAETAARRLLDLGCGACVVTLGSDGCLVVEREAEHVPVIRAEAVDTTAAGDAFNGALAVALAEGRPLIDAVRWASRAAAVAVTRRGAQPSLPRRDEIDR